MPESCDDATPADNVQIFLENGDVIETQLLIGADGNRSLVRESLGGENMSWEYNQETNQDLNCPPTGPLGS